MPRESFSLFNADGQLRQSEVRHVANVAAFALAGPVGLAYSLFLQGSFGNLVSPDMPQWMWVQIDGPHAGSGAYPYTQLYETTTAGTFATAPNPATDDILPLYEWKGRTDVKLGALERAWLSDDGTHYLFAASAGSLDDEGITVEATDGATYSDVTTLSVTENDGFTLTGPEDGEAHLALNAASATLKGVVNLTDGQVLGDGNKYFQDGVLVNATAVPSWAGALSQWPLTVAGRGQFGTEVRIACQDIGDSNEYAYIDATPGGSGLATIDIAGVMTRGGYYSPALTLRPSDTQTSTELGNTALPSILKLNGGTVATATTGGAVTLSGTLDGGTW